MTGHVKLLAMGIEIDTNAKAAGLKNEQVGTRASTTQKEYTWFLAERR